MICFSEFRKIKVRYSDKGKGRVIVLLHGFMESLDIFEDLSAQLSKRFRVISIDLPGHGHTPCIGYIHSMSLMAHCVKSVLDSLQLRRYVLVGHSMGGYVSLAFAELFPKSVAGVCLFHSTALPDSEEKKKVRERMMELVKSDKKHFILNFIPKLFASENVELLKDKIRRATQIAMRTPKEGIVASLRGMKERPSREIILKNIHCPVFFIIGKKDSSLAWDNLLLLTGLPKISSNIVLEEVGHMGFYEAPLEVFNGIRKFSAKCFSVQSKLVFRKS